MTAKRRPPKNPNRQRTPRRPGTASREHVNGDGKPKKKLSRRAAQGMASSTGMNAYKCSDCGAWHMGRTKDQQIEDGGRRPTRRRYET